ncbi:putative methyl transferase [Nautilia profundicola AmH]|uniref:Methyl transferase n=1 Tax=Nautilia profundicola (strain ATCC BAA-1463 / DSM 18972 / AmH) TaxID=598659 RepID=B9L7A5_NAUPA|nr:methyltransferase domain-containing protein [Nautilia profundicola]ACM92622.1 putative methyl transferase [Nautilia profundicola AmH]
MENVKLRSFDRFAHTYGQYNVIQKKIIKKYLPFLKNRVVDLGCGSEGLCKYKEFEFYLGIDTSEEMLKRNPCNTLKADFNDKKCFEQIKKYYFDQIVSFSALQWADDLEFVFGEIKKLKKEYLLAIFTSKTFKSLHKVLGIKSPIYSEEKILKASTILKPKSIEKLYYEMSFETPKELLEYIKFSGVSGNTKADVCKLKNFIKNFPVKYLEFEVLVIK